MAPRPFVNRRADLRLWAMARAPRGKPFGTVRAFAPGCPRELRGAGGRSAGGLRMAGLGPFDLRPLSF